MNKHVLFISYDGMTDPLGQSQVIPYLRGLAALNHRITIVSAEKSDRFKKYFPGIKHQLNVSNIEWAPVLFSKRFPGLSAWGNYYRLKKVAREICRNSQINIVHCRSLIPAMIGMSLKKKFRIKMIFDMRGFWADERVEGSLWNLSNPI